jgi:hypothetical protein
VEEVKSGSSPVEDVQMEFVSRGRSEPDCDWDLVSCRFTKAD